ncbi:hypothetical protein GCM10027578_07970 [Spirosoma luteolum]
MKKLCTLWLSLIPWVGYGQTGVSSFGFQYDQRPTVSVGGQPLLNPWAGGLNAMQYASLRLNADERPDLLVYDRTTRKASTFVAIDNPTGTGIAWQYAPEYEKLLPPLAGWVFAVDYDADGRNDLFTLVDGNVGVYHNDSQGNSPAFSLTTRSLMTQGFSGRQPVYVSPADLPAILDFDDDGDIDLLTFDPTGNLIAYQQNMSVERTGRKGGLDFKRPDCYYWGGFLKEFCNDFTFNINCDGSVGQSATPRKRPTGAARPLHSGNTLTILDTDGDGRKDMLFGAVSCPGVARLRNVATNDSAARFTSFDTLYPARNPILFPAFAGTSLVDADGDGVRDLMASPFVDQNDNNAYNFRASGLFYKNIGTNQKPDFQYRQADFLQSDMIDLGENAAPALADLDGDGDADLLVGYGGAINGKTYRAGLWQFENKGTLQNPAFSLVSTDYLGLGQAQTLVNVVPSFADLDGNGSLDLLVTAASAGGAVEIRVFLNGGVRGAPAQYNAAAPLRWPTPDLMQLGERLTVTDVDRDGKPDVLIGKNDGTIHYFRNTGTGASPVFVLQSQNFGNLPPDQTYSRARSLALADLNGDQKTELVTAASNGQVRIYSFPDQPNQPLALLDTLAGLTLPGTLLVGTLADLDGDQLPDLLLGSRAGGLRYLRNTSTRVVVTAVPETYSGPWTFPNPTDRYLTVRAPYDGQVELISLSGQVLQPAQAVKADTEQTLDLEGLADGTYLLRLRAPGRGPLVEKVVLWK